MQNLLSLFNEFRDCFAQNMSELVRTHLDEMEIKLTDDIPVTYRLYQLSYHERENVCNIVRYFSIMNELRMCIDYRDPNA